MKKLFTILIITFFINCSFSFANAGCLKSLDNELKATRIQLEKFSCKKKQSLKVKFTCEETAPKGWAKFYSNKFKNIENKILKCLI